MTYAATRAAVLSSIVGMSLAACATSPASETLVQADNPYGWMAGCWTTEDRAFREEWSVDGTQHLFGHNTFRHPSDPDKVVFFEQMRLMEIDGTWTFSAYPGGVGPSDFPRTASGPNRAEFTNPSHDFPQRISYQRVGDTLEAEIMTLDGERSQSWTFHPCRP